MHQLSTATLIMMRVALAAAFLLTLGLSWPLWGARESPPLLPLMPICQGTHFGFLIGLGLVVYVPCPRIGLLVTVASTLLACVADQARVQPQVLSLLFLMGGATGSQSGLFLARAHLVSLWLYAGLHKVLSAEYCQEFGPFLTQGLFSAEFSGRYPGVHVPLALGAACTELALGVSLFFPRIRRVSAVVVVLLHAGIVYVLHRNDNWNTTVWPWNIALAVVGAGLIVSWQGDMLSDTQRSSRRVSFAAIVTVLSPLLYYAGLMDAYLSHCVYSPNVPAAYIVTEKYRWQPLGVNNRAGPYWPTLGVSLSPTHRTFRQYCVAALKPGEIMVVKDGRWCAEAAGNAHYALVRTAEGVNRLPLTARKEIVLLKHASRQAIDTPLSVSTSSRTILQAERSLESGTIR
jgi:uncharacterized membrane protein YphA (DoxX/SURF4 family)